VGWARGETLRALKRLIAADNMTQKENAKTEAELAIARAMVRAGKPLYLHLSASATSAGTMPDPIENALRQKIVEVR
jgi:hypothetical protein